MADLVPLPRALFDRLVHAVDLDSVLRHAKLPRSRFRAAKPQATTAEFFAFWRAVEQGGAEPDLGLRLGVQALEDNQDVATIAARHSATLGEGLHTLARYKRLCCPEKVWIEVDEGEVRLRFEWLLTDDSPPSLVTDLLFAFVLSLAQRGTGRAVRPRRVELTRRRANESVLRRHFRCELRFDAPHDVMVFDEAILALPMINRNAQLLSVLLPGLELAVAKDPDANTLVDDVRLALQETMCGSRPAIATIARALGMSARTMQRRLGALGTTYQEVLDDVRWRAARRLSRTPISGWAKLHSCSVSKRSTHSFAFQGWEKTTPAKWRAKTSAASDGAKRHRLPPRRAL